MKRLSVLFLLAGLLGGLSSGFGAGMIIVEDGSWWPGPTPPRPIPPPWPPGPIPRVHPFAPLEVHSIKASTRITDQIAVTTLDQEFYNPNPARLEGTFVFPVPKGAHLDRFAMEIDGKPIEAELMPAEKARHIYEDIVRKMRDPALLEYAGRDIFKVRIFPIEPNSKKRIKLSYTQLLKADDGLISYLLPLSAGKFSCQPVKNVTVKVSLETKRPLKSIYSASHLVEVIRDGPNRATAAYEAAHVTPEDDFALYFAPEKDDIGVNLLTHRTHGEDGYFLLLASPGIGAKPRQVLAKDVAFVLDTSGSMAGKKLDQAKKALQFCIENLNENDRFELIRFSTEVEPLFEKLTDASPANRSKAEEFVKDLKPMGATAIDDALHKALDLQPDRDSSRPFVLIFLTDGRPTIGITDETEIVARVKKQDNGRTRIFCFGIGTDVNTHLLDKITEETRAFSQYVLPDEDLEVKVSSFFSKIKEPVLANPTLAFTGDVHTSKLYPSPLPDLFKGEQVVLAGRYSGHGDSAIVLEGNLSGSTRKTTYEVRFPEEQEDNTFIPRLWATRRVGYLLDEIRLHGENPELREEVTTLARKYGIVTPYTAYLIVEDEGRRNVPLSMRSLQEFDKDHELRQQAAQAWNGFKEESTGEAAVLGAQYGARLKMADAAAPAAAGGMETLSRQYAFSGAARPGNSAATAPPESQAARLIQYSQQTQFVAGKTFFQNNGQWLDSAIQQHSDAKRIRIQFGSQEYFDFAAKHPEASAWLALGQKVEFALDTAIYEIYE